MQNEKTSGAQTWAGWIILILPLAVLLILVIFPVISNFFLSFSDAGRRLGM